MRITTVTAISLSSDAPEQTVTVCGELCAERFEASVRSRSGDDQMLFVAGEADTASCGPCSECGLMIVADSCPSCSGMGCGSFRWAETRRAKEFAATWKKMLGEDPDPELVEAVRTYADLYPDDSGAQIAVAMYDARPGAAELARLV